MSQTTKLVILKLDGDCLQGFRATLEIGLEGNRSYLDWTTSIPAAVELVNAVEAWQQKYRNLDGITRTIRPQAIVYKGNLKLCLDHCREASRILEQQFKNWLNSLAFQHLAMRIRSEIHRDDAVRILIRTQDQLIYHLPWHQWELIDQHSQTEVTFADLHGLLPIQSTDKQSKTVRILAILGNADGIDIEADRALLNSLPNATVKFLVQPSRADVNQQLWASDWDILFFAGHSHTEEEKGRIYINSDDSLTLDELRYALKEAVANGLQLGIFNSCDGLGLAYELKQINLPRMIVMREPVPDPVAHDFLKTFLQEFSSGQSLHLAERKAREWLQGLENKFPCASWLPIVYQHPTATPITWEQLRTGESYRSEQNPVVELSWSQALLHIGLLTFIVTSLVMGVRFLGGLQFLEFWAFDQLMQRRPSEPLDERIVLITIDEADLQYQTNQGMTGRGSLSNEALAQLLTKISSSAEVIGLDIYRDFPTPANYPELASQLQSIPNLVATCLSLGDPEDQPISPPPEIATNNVGFSDVVTDPDYRVRRSLIGMTPGEVCPTSESLSYQLAKRYLESRQNLLMRPGDEQIQLGEDRHLIRSRLHDGVYHRASFGGYQSLINYRQSAEVARSMSLSRLLETDDVDELNRRFKDRIVIVGTTAQSYQDYHLTPYGERSGVIIQAHLTSQLISAALDQRPLLQFIPQWADAIWVWTWAFGSGCLVWLLRSKVNPVFILLIMSISLIGCCYVALLQGIWLPVIPSVLVVIVSATSVIWKIPKLLFEPISVSTLRSTIKSP